MKRYRIEVYDHADRWPRWTLEETSSSKTHALDRAAILAEARGVATRVIDTRTGNSL